MIGTEDRIALEAVVDELRAVSSIALSENENEQLAHAEVLLRSGDPAMAQVGANTLRKLQAVARQAEKAEFLREIEAEVIGTIDADGIHRTLHAELSSTSATLAPMAATQRLLTFGAAITVCAFGAFAMCRTSAGNTVAISSCLAIVAMFLCATLHMHARLLQNAREADERMHLRSALSRPFAKAVTVAAQRGDFNLLDRMIGLMPHQDSEHSVTLGPDDIRVALAGIAALSPAPRQGGAATSSRATVPPE